MGIVEHVNAKCPTPGCLGSFYDQVKTGDYGSYYVPTDGFMEAHAALAVDGCEMHCHACGATARVQSDPQPKVRVRLVDIKIGDTNLTIPVRNFRIEKVNTRALEEHGIYLTRRRLQGFKYWNPDAREYLYYQSLAGVMGETQSRNFDFTLNGVTYEGRTWISFKDNPDHPNNKE